MKKQINALGKPCPIPVIETKRMIQLLQNEGGGTIEIMVDNDIARQNLQKMATGMSLPMTYDVKTEDKIEVTIEVPQIMPITLETPNPGKLVVSIGTNSMGTGNDDLGRNLMKSFLYSLTEIDHSPSYVLLYNGGIHLTTEGSASIDDLKILEEKGAKILSCGACLNFYKKETALLIGEPTNMFEIVKILSEHPNKIQL